MTSAKPFTVRVPDEMLAGIAAKVRAYEWHEMPEDGGWAYGTNLDYMKALCAYWVEEYDWRRHEAAFNRFAQFTAPVDGLDLHFIHEKGSGAAPLPLLISHGWPGSVYEFLEIVEPLAHPERFGGSAEDAFDVIAPSLPGFGFSGKPARPIGPRKVAAMFAALMTEVLGYDRYLAQGGDWGSMISSWIGFDHAPPCRAIHLNMMSLRTSGIFPETEDEKAWAARAKRVFEAESGYMHEQETKPQTLSYAMMDSPVGVAAWIVEKFHRWSDTTGDDIESRYTKDQLLTNVMVYLVTRTFNTATWIYRGRRDENRGLLPPGRRVEVPVGVAAFPAEFIPWPPRSFAEKAYNITRWTDMPRGGHFAAMEEPELFVDDLRAFARTVR